MPQSSTPTRVDESSGARRCVAVVLGSALLVVSLQLASCRSGSPAETLDGDPGSALESGRAISDWPDLPAVIASVEEFEAAFLDAEGSTYYERLDLHGDPVFCAYQSVGSGMTLIQYSIWKPTEEGILLLFAYPFCSGDLFFMECGDSIALVEEGVEAPRAIAVVY